MTITAIDWGAVLGRLEVAVEVLSTRHVHDGFVFDRALADRATPRRRRAARAVSQ